MRIGLTQLLQLGTALCLSLSICLLVTAILVPAKAADAPEKFALMVGIDQYRSPQIPQLDGSKADINDMKHVLVEKFGFANDNDHIVTLYDNDATKDAIMKAFRSHLIENAKKHPDGIFLFEYSGHGSRVKDPSHRKADGMAETMVPYDSRTKDHFDLYDTEFLALSAELARYTNNITYILDSCHSGTATRALEKVRQITDDTREQPPPPPVPSGIDANSIRNCVSISACRPAETAAEAGDQSHPNGLMTSKLVQAMKNCRGGCTYRELWQDVSSSVSRDRPDQHPLIEGDIDRTIFGDSTQRTPPYMSIASIDGSNATIKAGTIQGLRTGTVIALYKGDSDTLSGNKDLLATCPLTQVSDFTSQFSIPSGVDEAAVKTAKAVVITPNFASKVRVVLQSDSHTDAHFLDSLSKMINSKGVLEVKTSAPDPLKDRRAWDLSVLHGTFGDYLAHGGTVDPVHPVDAQSTGYYVVAPYGKPLYGMFIRDQSEGATEKLTDALFKQASQNNLRALKNEVGDLDKQVAIELVPSTPGDSQSSAGQNQSGAQELKLGERAKLRITNNANVPLYVALIAINTDGSVELIYPPENAEDLIKPGISVMTGTFKATEPCGFETVKAMISTKPVDLSFMNQSGVNTRSIESGHPLACLLRSGLGMPSTRGFESVSEDQPVDSWAATNLDFVIAPASQ